MAEKLGVLYVDDEDNNLNSFRAYFRKEYNVHTATNAKDAFLVLENNSIAVIISDQRMPTITGVEFLKQTIEKHPDSMRVLITAYANIEVVIEAINQGQINKFVEKPWEWDKLSLIIENCALIYKSRVELKQKNEELQKTNHELTKFVYSVSHDLRAPLMSILGIVQLSKQTKQSKITEDYFENIKTCIIKLDTFIINIIDYYKNSHAEDIKDNIDFKGLVSHVLDTLEHLDDNITFEWEIEQSEKFFGDLFRLEVVIKNLISNAVKYQNPKSKSPFVKIKITSTKKEACIIISDNGIGIEQEHIQHVFKLFFRIGNTHRQEGAGIGLYIVKEAIEKMKGKISIESTPLAGSSFTITVPNQNISD